MTAAVPGATFQGLSRLRSVLRQALVQRATRSLETVAPMMVQPKGKQQTEMVYFMAFYSNQHPARSVMCRESKLGPECASAPLAVSLYPSQNS